MQLREIGNTGVEVSVLGFGGGAYAGLLVRGEASQQASAVRHAIDAGLTYFDTAAQYGDGLSEANLGRALVASGVAGRAVVGTKVRLPEAALSEPAGAIRDSLAESLKRLQRDHVDVFVLHNFPRKTPGRDHVYTEHLPAIAGAMRDLQKDGLVRCIGFTCVGETPALREAADTGLFDFAQVYFNVLNPSAVYAGASGGGQDFAGIIPPSPANGANAMAVRSVAGGALVASDYRAPLAGPTGGGGGLGGNPYASDLERARRLQPLVDELGLENALEFGLRFAISHPAIASSLVGFSDEDQLEEALRWVERGPLPADAIERAVELARLP